MAMDEHTPDEFTPGTIVVMIDGNESWEVECIDTRGWVLMTNLQQVHYTELEIQEA